MIWLGNKIERFCAKVEKSHGRILEILAMIIYTIGHFLMAVVHEPWYDEAVAWQIARCASIKNILFEIPHYEGHPPLWHLILLPFAKLGASYELSLTIVSFVFAGTAVALIIWKSPFPRIVRILLPFTYFFFYQYGVISRPYCVMMLAFVVLAMTYQKRNEYPGKYTLSLMLLCLTSAYGIVIAGGLAIVWVWEIWDKQNIIWIIERFKGDRRIHYLLMLLLLAIALIVAIMPKGETGAINYMINNKSNSWFIRMLYMLFALLPDVTITNVYAQYGFLRDMQVPFSIMAVVLLGILIWCLVFMWGKSKKTVAMLVIPYMLFSVFSVVVYFCTHHTGIGLLLLVFWIWISIESPYSDKYSCLFSQKDLNKLKSLVYSIIMFSFVVSIYWNVYSCFQDIAGSYAVGRNEAEFIDKYSLDDYQIMAGWEVVSEGNNIKQMDVNYCYLTDNIAPYFKNNLFFNFNDGRNDMNYTTHRRANEEEEKTALEKWKRIQPDVLYMNPELELVYDEDELSMDDYTLVYSEISSRIWKGQLDYSRAEIHVRNDLLDKLGLQAVERKYPPGAEILGKYVK